MTRSNGKEFLVNNLKRKKGFFMALFFVWPHIPQNAPKIKMLASNSFKFDGKLTDDDSGPDSPLYKLTMADME
jgi:hypothetical protein